MSRPDGSQRKLLVRGHDPLSGEVSNLGWSPDGTRIFFVFWNVGPVELQLFSIKPDGSGRRSESPPDWGSGLLAGVWSPNRTQRAYVRWQDGQLVVVKADGTDARQVSSDSPLRAESPAWSPDGTELAFVVRPLYRGWPAPPGDVSVVHSDGSSERRLPTTRFDEAVPAWRLGDHQGFGPCTPPRPTHPRVVTVPSVVRGDVLSALARLRQSGLRVAIAQRFSLDSRAVPLVDRQRPAAGAHVRWRGGVSLRLGGQTKGVIVIDVTMPSYRVPDFTGRPLSEAVRWSYDKPEVWWLAPDLPPLAPSDAGTLLDAYRVVSQDPPPGSTLTPVGRNGGRNVFAPLTLRSGRS